MRDEMADFKQAVEWMKEGKKVRRECWMNTFYWDTELIDTIEHPTDSRRITLSLEHFEATDWEIFKEEYNWNLANAFKSGIGTMTENTKTFIQKVKKDNKKNMGYHDAKQANDNLDKRAGNL